MSEEKTKATEKDTAKKDAAKKGKVGLIIGIVCGAVALIVAAVLIFVISTGYHKKTETFTIKNESRGSELSFDFAAEELGYEAKDSYNGIEFSNPEDKSSIRVRLYDANERDIIKPADSFYSDNYHDWSEIKVGDYQGFKIYYNAELFGKVEMALVLDMYDESKSRVDGITLEVVQSPMQPRASEFDPIKFYESEDFQHILKTIKFTAPESTKK